MPAQQLEPIGDVLASMTAGKEDPKDYPWSDWPIPEVVKTEVHGIVMSHDEAGRVFFCQTEEVTHGPVLGLATPNALRELSTRIGFPLDFVRKLTPGLQTAVLNERIQRAPNLSYSFVIVEGQVTDAVPGKREIVPHAEIVQSAYDQLKKTVEGEPDVVVEDAQGRLSFRLLTGIEEAVTKKPGDVLRMGIEVEHAYGFELRVCLYTERLVCANGMTAVQRDYEWTSSAAGTKEEQLFWLRQRVFDAAQAFSSFVERAKAMAAARIEGDPGEALIRRARLLGLPRSQDALLIEAFDEEPGATEWDLLNAFTRFATHDAGSRLGKKLQSQAGRTVEQFEVVKAELPLSVARKVGAKILAS
jgi:hypothetical protein